MHDQNEKWDLKQLGWRGFLVKLYRHHKPSGGMLILRLAVGILMVAAGWWKVGHMDMAIGYGTMMGFPAFSTIFVSWVELIGGIFLIVGFLTKPTCVAFAIEMAVIIWGTPSSPSIIYWGHDYNFILLAIFLALYVGGPGKYSLSWLIWGRKHAV